MKSEKLTLKLQQAIAQHHVNLLENEVAHEQLPFVKI